MPEKKRRRRRDPEVRDETDAKTLKSDPEVRDGVLVFAEGEHEVAFNTQRGAATTHVLGGIRVEKGASVKMTF